MLALSLVYVSEPVAPVGPVTPMGPVIPVGPVMPMGPGTPVGPVLPVTPVAPVGPINGQQHGWGQQLYGMQSGQSYLLFIITSNKRENLFVLSILILMEKQFHNTNATKLLYDRKTIKVHAAYVQCRHTLQKQISIVKKGNEAENLLVLEKGKFKRKGDINEPFGLAILWSQNHLSGCYNRQSSARTNR